MSDSHHHIRRAKALGRDIDHGITKAALRDMDGDGCCYCGVALDFGKYGQYDRPPEMATLEHLTPLSEGGSHTWTNVALACWQDNSAKGAATEGWTVRAGHRLHTGGSVPNEESDKA